MRKGYFFSFYAAIMNSICTPIPAPKPSEQLVRDAVYNTNGFRLPREAVFGLPAVWQAPPDDISGRDTTVVVSMPTTSCSRDTGARQLLYQRLDLSQLQPVAGAQIVVKAVPFTLYSLLDQINTYYGVKLDQTDVIDQTFNTVTGPFNLAAQPTSLAWKNQVALPVVFDLPDLVTHPDLSGFTAVS
jgi:hypothetical protein